MRIRCASVERSYYKQLHNTRLPLVPYVVWWLVLLHVAKSMNIERNGLELIINVGHAWECTIIVQNG